MFVIASFAGFAAGMSHAGSAVVDGRLSADVITVHSGRRRHGDLPEPFGTRRGVHLALSRQVTAQINFAQ